MRDRINRVISVQNTANSATVASYGYQYNQANQRTNVTLVDNSKWRYEYDALGQVTSGKRFWADDSAVGGQQYEYLFDDIGNRKTATPGVTQNGGNSRIANYTPHSNALNQYANRTVPGFVDVIGEANAGATVTVNNQQTTRHGEYFWATVDAANNGANVWRSIDTVGALNRSGNTDIVTLSSGKMIVPATPQIFTYDADGNLEDDLVWHYTWDAENRLIQMDSHIPASTVQHVTFEYDWQGRRIRKLVQGTPNSDTRYLYDGWNLLAEIDASSAVKRSYMWGLDLSGSMQVAGGVGGLLALYDSGTAATYFAAQDANGNVTALVKASDGSTCANYEYGPFGELIRATGPMAKANPFRFSTKYTDDETDLVYYGYRYYSPSMGRFISRDPIEEEGGVNLYGFLGNQPVNTIDFLGMWKIERHSWESWAKATMDSSNDTKESLAALLRLEPNEFSKWATEIDCRVYRVPNTVVVYTSKPQIGDGLVTYVRRLRKLAVNYAEAYSKKDYKIDFHLNEDNEDMFIRSWGTEGIYAVIFAGHGSVAGFKAAPSKPDSAQVDPGQVKPPYKLQAVLALACNTSAMKGINGETWKTYRSNTGSYLGFWWFVNWVNSWNDCADSINMDDVPPR